MKRSTKRGHPFLDGGKWNGSLLLPSSLHSLSHSLARPFSIKLTHIRSAGNESTRVFECIVEAYPEHLYERREDDTTGLSCELRFDSRSCTLSDADTGRWWREKRAERGENEKREREKEGRKEEERRENSSNGNHD